MILLYDKDDNVVLLNPDYMVGAHQEGDMTVINCVGDMVYKVQGTPEDVHDAWTGVGEVEVELEEDCDTCRHKLNGPSDDPCNFCTLRHEDQVDSHWEPEDISQPSLVAVSGVPYKVPVTDIRMGDKDE